MLGRQYLDEGWENSLPRCDLGLVFPHLGFVAAPLGFLFLSGFFLAISTGQQPTWGSTTHRVSVFCMEPSLFVSFWEVFLEALLWAWSHISVPSPGFSLSPGELRTKCNSRTLQSISLCFFCSIPTIPSLQASTMQGSRSVGRLVMRFRSLMAQWGSCCRHCRRTAWRTQPLCFSPLITGE